MLYLVQHGDALSKEEDPERPLSDRGRVETEVVASFLARERPLIGQIAHSGKLRARQTAEILGRGLGVTEEVVERDGLAPNDDPALWRERIESAAETVLVGHLPHLARLAGLLLTGDDARCPVRFCNSGILCLVHEPEESQAWAVAWYLTPDVVPVGTA